MRWHHRCVLCWLGVLLTSHLSTLVTRLLKHIDRHRTGPRACSELKRGFVIWFHVTSSEPSSGIGVRCPLVYVFHNFWADIIPLTCSTCFMWHTRANNPFMTHHVMVLPGLQLRKHCCGLLYDSYSKLLYICTLVCLFFYSLLVCIVINVLVRFSL